MVKNIQPPTVALYSLGCKLNQAEIQRLAQELAQAGCTIVASSDKADIYILNTCTVTHIADHKSRHLLRFARRRNPSARLVAIGCYAHRAPEELKKIDGVDLVLNNNQKNDLVSILKNAGGINGSSPVVSTNWRDFGRRTRAFLKVQDGCRNFCAYCIVPYVRVSEASLPVLDIISQVKEKVSTGFQEVVLTGTEIGAYRFDGIDLAGLIERILAETEVPRLRLSSLQPHHISPRLIKLWRDPRLCPHFHLSLQSGNDSVLSRMNRKYNTRDYRRAVVLICSSVPGVAITTDVIVGFPGESGAEFQETLNFCREIKFARIHVFLFSPRPGTAAATMPGQISAAVKKERAAELLALAKESSKNFRYQFVGRTMEVLWEQSSRGVWSGLTGNYIRVYVTKGDDLANKIMPVKLLRIYGDGIWGELLLKLAYIHPPSPPLK